MLCSNCGVNRTIARGICSTCYSRLKRTGSLVRRNAQNQGRLCTAEGCGQPAHAKGLCAHHYAHAEHPLKATWRILRSRNPGHYPAKWDRFDRFLADVGERPSPKHQLRRVDHEKPWSVANLTWLAPLHEKQQHYTPEQQATYGREWRLRRLFKLTGGEYAALLIAQDGGCGICGAKETHVSKNGKLKDLAVDHDHATGEVRGLLCFNCNQGIGRFQNSPERLEAAAVYLRRTRRRVVGVA